MDKLNELTEGFRTWIISNSSNPVLWIGIFVVGILVFFLTYESLNKNR